MTPDDPKRTDGGRPTKHIIDHRKWAGWELLALTSFYVVLMVALAAISQPPLNQIALVTATATLVTLAYALWQGDLNL